MKRLSLAFAALPLLAAAALAAVAGYMWGHRARVLAALTLLLLLLLLLV